MGVEQPRLARWLRTTFDLLAYSRDESDWRVVDAGADYSCAVSMAGVLVLLGSARTGGPGDPSEQP